MLFALVLSPIGLQAQLMVDCSGTNSDQYPRINAALQKAATVGTTILVTGTCAETVNLQGMVHLNPGAPYGQTAALRGALTISHSQNVFLYGLQVTNSPIDGITISDSTAVFLEGCTANGNTLNGLRVQNMSEVAVIGAGGAFNNNGGSGVWANVGSVMWFNNWAGPVEVSNNALDGIACEQSTCGVLGNATIANNGMSSVNLVPGSKMEFAADYGPNIVRAINRGESPRSSAPGFRYLPRRRPSVETGRLASARAWAAKSLCPMFRLAVTRVLESTCTPTAQAWLHDANHIENNGSSADPTSAAVRIDGNSEAYMRGGTVAQNKGPALMVLVNSSADFSGVSFVSNTGGIIACDNSAVMVSDLAPGAFGPSGGANCKRPQLVLNHQISTPVFTSPNSAAQRAVHEKYFTLASKH